MIHLKYHMLRFHRGGKGQSMVEFCVAAPVLVLLWWSIWYLTEMFLVKHETLVAARYGTWLLSRYDNVPQNGINFQQVSDRIANNFFKNRPQQSLSIVAQHLDTNSGETEVFQDDASELSQSLRDFFSNNMLGAETPALYSLKVQYDYPTLFGAVDLRKGNNHFFEIQSDHHVLGNSWDGQRVEVHDVRELVEELISDIIEEVTNL
jgi:hypothetical protein